MLGGVGGYWAGHTTAASPTTEAGTGTHQHHGRDGPDSGPDAPGGPQARGATAGSATSGSGAPGTGATA